MSTAATATIARPYASPPRFPSAATRLLSAAEEHDLFTAIRAAHSAAWAACLAAPGAVDGRDHDPEWYALRAAQDAAITHASHVERTATDGAKVLDAWILRHDVTDTRRTLERLVDRALKANLRLATHLAARYHRSALMLSDRVTTVLTVCSTHPRLYHLSAKQDLFPVNTAKTTSTNTQAWPPGYLLNGCFVYLVQTKALLKEKIIITKKTKAVVCPKWRSVDLDTPEEWVLAEISFKNQKKIKAQLKKMGATDSL